MMTPSLNLLLACAVVVILLLYNPNPRVVEAQDPAPVAVSKEDVIPKVLKFLEEFDKEKKLHYGQLKRWYENNLDKVKQKYITQSSQSSTSTQTGAGSNSSSSSTSSSSSLYSSEFVIDQNQFPRLFPFCVTHQQITDYSRLNKEDSHLDKFKNIFRAIKSYHDHVDQFYHFNKMNHSTKYNKDFIEYVDLSRINTPDLEMVNMRQWVHITVKASSNVGTLQGLYMQSIVGQLGLPDGEFNLDFPCTEKTGGGKKMKDVGRLHFCHYRSRYNLIHPNVYIGHSVSGVKTFHVHFRYSDITCMETPYMQFLIIAVKEFKANPVHGSDYQIIFSPVFVSHGMDTFDGVSYPYFPLWENKMMCGIKSLDDFTRKYTSAYSDRGFPLKKRKPHGDYYWSGLTWKEANDTLRILPNEEYDSCVTGRKTDGRDDERLECPPGPFQCPLVKPAAYTMGEKLVTAAGGSNTNVKLMNEKIAEQRKKLVEEQKVMGNKCKICGLPPCDAFRPHFTNETCSGGENYVISVISKNDTSILEKIESIARHKSHAVLAALGTLVFLPIANYMGRFYKEVCRNCLCGNGPWIFIHIFFHLIGVVIMWVSIGPIVASISNYEDVKEECSALHFTKEKIEACANEKSIYNPHIPLGVGAFFFQNINCLTGFFRSSKNKLRIFQLIFHGHTGYLAFLLAGFAALVATINNSCLEMTGLLGVLFMIPIIFFFVGCICDIISDKKIGVNPKRKQWPILEPIKLDKRGPLEPCKWCIFAIFVLLLFAVWILVLASSNTASKQNDPEGFDPSSPSQTLYSSFSGEKGKLKGLFGGECGSMSET